MRETNDKYDCNENVLKEDSSLKINAFSVPENYFGQLEEISTFRAKNNPAENGGLSVPADYFEKSTLQIQARISEDGLKKQLLNDGFATPEHYFDQLTDAILVQTLRKSKADAKVRKIVFPTWSKYVAAACALIFSGLLITNSLNENTNELADISDQELINYLQLYGDSKDMLLFTELNNDQLNFDSSYEEGFDPDISASDIEWYLQNTL